jgi:L-cysteine/cystine lyase
MDRSTITPGTLRGALGSLPVPALDELRAEFPVLERVAYLNAGTDGPVPRGATEATAAAVEHEVRGGRGGRPHFQGLLELRDRIAAHVGALLGRPPAEVALTRSTTDGINTVLHGLDMALGDEIVTSDEEHPGLLAPLAAAQRRRGVEVRVVPFDRVSDSVGPRTRLVACSHVSWITGRAIDLAALRASDALVLLDGAQGLGAVPIDLDSLGCDFYAASGQKWLCGPDGSGYLWVRPERLDECAPPWPWYGSLAEPGHPLELGFHADARRYDTGVVPRSQAAWALTSLELLAGAGFDRVLERGRAQAARLAQALSERNLQVTPRGDTTLVAWEADNTADRVARLAAEGVVLRDLPGRGLLRASVGAWTSDEEIERLAELAAAS